MWWDSENLEEGALRRCVEYMVLNPRRCSTALYWYILGCGPLRCVTTRQWRRAVSRSPSEAMRATYPSEKTQQFPQLDEQRPPRRRGPFRSRTFGPAHRKGLA